MFITALPSFGQVNKVAGIYSDNFALYGFFTTALQLSQDMTFKYSWGGDQQSDRGIGTYKLNHDTILLSFIASKYDTLYKFYWDSIYSTSSLQPNDSGQFHFSVYHKNDTIKKPGYTLSTYINDRPTKFLYKHSHLYYITKEGKVSYIKCKVFIGHKKFLLFGSGWGMKKIYLVKRTHWTDNF